MILKGIRGKYEEHHNVNFTDKLLAAAAKLTDRYVTGRFSDKAIDALDEASPFSDGFQETLLKSKTFRMKSMKYAPSRKELYPDQKFEEAAATETKRRSQAKRERVLENWKKMREEKRFSVDEDDMP